jgi:hypothetical protein
MLALFPAIQKSKEASRKEQYQIKKHKGRATRISKSNHQEFWLHPLSHMKPN